MSRKHKNRKPQSLRCFVFTPETIKLAQEAMKLFAQALTRAENQSAKAAFAREMMQQVNGKLDAMAKSVGVMCLTAFDYNEKIVLATSIQLYMLDLIAVSASSQREKELQRCRQIMRFALDPGRESGQ
jgi:hypothetical protein